MNECLNWFCVTTEIFRNIMKPFVFRNFDSNLMKIQDDDVANTMDHSQSYLKDGYTLSDALMSSFAIPRFFGDYKLGKKTFKDGGILSNSPIKQAIMESKSLWPHRDLCIVSIGCGMDFDSKKVITSVLTDWETLSQVTELQWDENKDILRMMGNHTQTF